MSRLLTTAAVVLAVYAGRAGAADIDGKLKSVDPDKKTIVLTVGDKDQEFSIPETADLTVQDIMPYKPKEGLKDSAFQKDRAVKITIETKDGKDVVTKLVLYTGRKG
jgi:hypothetical protein